MTAANALAKIDPSVWSVKEQQNLCEKEIIGLIGKDVRTHFKDRQTQLMYYLGQIDALSQDKIEWWLSHQTYEWYWEAYKSFKKDKPLPELPNVEALRYRRDDEDYVPPEHFEPSQGQILQFLAAQEEVEAALAKLHALAEKVKPKHVSRYRLADPSEGARWYLFPELDRYGLLMGCQAQKAAEMFERGATMKEVKAACGYEMYNLLRRLRQKGHKVTWVRGLFKLTHKDDRKRRKP